VTLSSLVSHPCDPNSVCPHQPFSLGTCLLTGTFLQHSLGSYHELPRQYVPLFLEQPVQCPSIGDNQQENQDIQDQFAAKPLVPPIRQKVSTGMHHISDQEKKILYSHVLKNPTSLQGEFVCVAHVLVGHLKLLTLSAHLAQRFTSNLLCFGTQTSRSR
jgi:hypothetical protein